MTTKAEIKEAIEEETKLIESEIVHLHDLQREVDALRNDFQNLEQLFHSTRETLEAQIEQLRDELLNR